MESRTRRKTGYKTQKSSSDLDNLLGDFLPGGATQFLLWSAQKPDAIGHLAEGAVRNWLSGSGAIPKEALPAALGALQGAQRAIEHAMQESLTNESDSGDGS